jgi:hypothetical protein
MLLLFKVIQFVMALRISNQQTMYIMGLSIRIRYYSIYLPKFSRLEKVNTLNYLEVHSRNNKSNYCNFQLVVYDYNHVLGYCNICDMQTHF